MNTELIKEKGTKATALASALIIIIIIALNLYGFQETAAPESSLTNQTPGKESVIKKDCIELPRYATLGGRNVTRVTGCQLTAYDKNGNEIETKTEVKGNYLVFNSSDCLKKDQRIEIKCDSHEYLGKAKDLVWEAKSFGGIALKKITEQPEGLREITEQEKEEIEASHPCNGNMTFETRYDSYRCFEKREEFVNCTYYFLKKGRELEEQSSMFIDSEAVGFYSTALNCARKIEEKPEIRVKVESYRNEYKEWGESFHVTANDIDELINKLSSTRFE